MLRLFVWVNNRAYSEFHSTEPMHCRCSSYCLLPFLLHATCCWVSPGSVCRPECCVKVLVPAGIINTLF